MYTNTEHTSCEVCGKTFDDNSTVIEMQRGELGHEECCECCSECGSWFDRHEAFIDHNCDVYCESCYRDMICECAECGDEVGPDELMDGLCEKCLGNDD